VIVPLCECRTDNHEYRPSVTVLSLFPVSTLHHNTTKADPGCLPHTLELQDTPPHLHRRTSTPRAQQHQQQPPKTSPRRHPCRDCCRQQRTAAPESRPATRLTAPSAGSARPQGSRGHGRGRTPWTLWACQGPTLCECKCVWRGGRGEVSYRKHVGATRCGRGRTPWTPWACQGPA
jgi:hypothetical protein